MTTFQPTGYHYPNSCLCGMCKDDDDCEEACDLYKQMAHGCEDDCANCKLTIEERMKK